MDRKKAATSVSSSEEEALSGMTDGVAEVMSIGQIQRLVRLLDHSDVAELELKRDNEDMHLVLRKVKAPDGSMQTTPQVLSYAASSNGAAPMDAMDERESSVASRHIIKAPLVGIFHPWLKPRGGTLVAVGDHVKAGQLVGTIESLNVFNEIEATVAGRVVEIHVRDGQPVEYGQALVTLDDSEAEAI
ncbi:MAG TPA: biotin/lipoyl-containing protein [Ktedonobacteraceae bacterium]|nr:biotin/lipoyl-containing protein [Ktedonobacteraceae bacterium]